jgi:nicotinate-nucleotide adenylyltransferase
MKLTKKIYDLQSLEILHSMEGKNIGILGGSFNPSHNGHVLISQVALDKYNIDYVIWLVAYCNPLKIGQYEADIFARAEQSLKFIPDERILISTAECEIKSMDTYDSLSLLVGRFPNINFTWLMGLDNAQHFNQWKGYKEISKLCRIIVFDRPGLGDFDFEKFRSELHGKDVLFSNDVQSHISSSQIRKNRVATV